MSTICIGLFPDTSESQFVRALSASDSLPEPYELGGIFFRAFKYFA